MRRDLQEVRDAFGYANFTPSLAPSMPSTFPSTTQPIGASEYLPGGLSDLRSSLLSPRIEPAPRDAGEMARLRAVWDSSKRAHDILTAPSMDLMTTFTTVRQSLIERYPKLTRVELKICTLIKLNFSSKEIANVLCLSKRTIDCHRWRLTKKLEVPEGSTLALVVASV